MAGAEDRLVALSARYDENFSYQAFISSFTETDGQITLDASVMLERANQTIDLTSSNLVTGGIDGDIFVLAGSETGPGAGDDLVIGGFGSDRYEVRILSEDGEGNAINADRGNVVINELGRYNGIEEDSILFEGVSSIADLSFTRTTVSGEGEGQSLQIGYQLENSDGDAAGSGTVELFNQYSLSQSHLYNVENLQIIDEVENTLEASVSEYSFGDVMGSTSDGGDILAAMGSDNAILVGSNGKSDEFRTDLMDVNKDVWLYGFDKDGPNADSVVLDLNASTALSPVTGMNVIGQTSSGFDLELLLGDGSTVSVSGQISEFVDGLANGEKVSLTLELILTVILSQMYQPWICSSQMQATWIAPLY